MLLAVGFHTAPAQETVGFSDPAATRHLENYRLPTWEYNVLFLDFDGNFNSINHFNDAVDRTTFGRVAPAYRYYRESEAMIIEGFANVPLTMNRWFNEDPNGNERTDNNFGALLNGVGDAKYYLDDLLFALGHAEININTNRRTTDGDNQQEIFRRTADSRFMIAAGAGGGNRTAVPGMGCSRTGFCGPPPVLR